MAAASSGAASSGGGGGAGGEQRAPTKKGVQCRACQGWGHKQFECPAAAASAAAAPKRAAEAAVAASAASAATSGKRAEAAVAASSSKRPAAPAAPPADPHAWYVRCPDPQFGAHRDRVLADHARGAIDDDAKRVLLRQLRKQAKRAMRDAGMRDDEDGGGGDG